MTLDQLLTKFKLIPAPTRTILLTHFIDKIDIPTTPHPLAFLFQADKFCKNPREKAAFSVVLNFAQEGGTLRGFPTLSRPLVAYQLGLRILDPARIQQGVFGLCGPTAFAVDVLRSDPHQFVKCAVELATSGTSRLRGRDIVPGADIRNYTTAGIPHADFLVLASLRSSDEVLIGRDLSAKLAASMA
jgi:hypothetical protein